MLAFDHVLTLFSLALSGKRKIRTMLRNSDDSICRSPPTRSIGVVGELDCGVHVFSVLSFLNDLSPFARNQGASAEKRTEEPARAAARIGVRVAGKCQRCVLARGLASNPDSPQGESAATRGGSER